MKNTHQVVLSLYYEPYREHKNVNNRRGTYSCKYSMLNAFLWNSRKIVYIDAKKEWAGDATMWDTAT